MGIHSRSGNAAWSGWVALPTPNMELKARLRGLRLPYAELYWKEGRNTLPGLICKAADFVESCIGADTVLYVGSPDHRSRSAAYLLYNTGRVVPLGRLIDVGENATHFAPRSWYAAGRFFIATHTDRPTCFANERGGADVLDAMASGNPTRISLVS